jgi:hypothetical protein
MRKLYPLAIAALTVGLLTACSKKEAPAPQPAPAPAPVAAQPQPPAEPAPPAEQPAAPAEDPEVVAKRAAIEFALAEQTIADEATGQWAATSSASSTYNGAKDKASYSDWQATGAPNVVAYGDNGNGWAPKEADGGIEWLQLGFAKPVHATELRIRQNSAPGAIIKIELIDDQNNKHEIFNGMDSNKYPPNTIAWFKQAVEKTTYLVTGAKITLATNAVHGWNEIDAVQLLGE